MFKMIFLQLTNPRDKQKTQGISNQNQRAFTNSLRKNRMTLLTSKLSQKTREINQQQKTSQSNPQMKVHLSSHMQQFITKIQKKGMTLTSQKLLRVLLRNNQLLLMSRANPRQICHSQKRRTLQLCLVLYLERRTRLQFVLLKVRMTLRRLKNERKIKIL